MCQFLASMLDTSWTSQLYTRQSLGHPPDGKRGGILQSLSTTEDCSQGLESHRQGLVMGGMEQDGNNRSQVQGSCVESTARDGFLSTYSILLENMREPCFDCRLIVSFVSCAKRACALLASSSIIELSTSQDPPGCAWSWLVGRGMWGRCASLERGAQSCFFNMMHSRMIFVLLDLHDFPGGWYQHVGKCWQAAPTVHLETYHISSVA